MKNILDFVVIGAQKSGTTTLFELLKQHKQIFLPTSKEAPFFGRPDMEEKGWEWYIKEFFSMSNENLMWGTITPHYMYYPNVAGRLFNVNPKTKIIAILRDPYSRAYSHFLMSSRRGLEKRSFEDAVKELISPNSLKDSRNISTETNSYIVRGEYGRILSDYKKYFGEGNILILFMEDLEKYPQDVLNKIYTFLNITEDVPQGIGQKYHKGSKESKFKFLNTIMWDLKKNRLFMTAVRKILPASKRKKLWFKIDQWNIKPPDNNLNQVKEDCWDDFLSGDTKEKFRQVYITDASIFEKEFSKQFPWKQNL